MNQQYTFLQYPSFNPLTAEYRKMPLQSSIVMLRLNVLGVEFSGKLFDQRANLWNALKLFDSELVFTHYWQLKCSTIFFKLPNANCRFRYVKKYSGNNPPIFPIQIEWSLKISKKLTNTTCYYRILQITTLRRRQQWHQFLWWNATFFCLLPPQQLYFFTTVHSSYILTTKHTTLHSTVLFSPPQCLNWF